MAAYLLDTDVLLAARKGGGAPAGVMAWFVRAALPVQAIAAVRAGIRQLWAREQAVEALALESWLEAVLREYAARIVEFDLDSALVWGRLQHANGLPGQIAAMAMAHDLIAVSGRLDDFVAQGLRLETRFPRKKTRSAAWCCLVVLVLWLGQRIMQGVFQRIGSRNRIFFLGPGAQVDLLAAFRAERAVFAGFGPLDFGTTGRAIYNWHDRDTLKH